MATVINSIKESELPNIITQACLNNNFWEGKTIYKTNNNDDSTLSLVSADSINYAEPLFCSIILAIASTLGKIKKANERRVLSFCDLAGNFICGFWIELDDDWTTGVYFDQADLKKIPDKNIKPHTEVTTLYIEPDSDMAHFIFQTTKLVFLMSADLLNRMIIESLISLKFYMELNASEEPFTFKLAQTVDTEICSEEYRAILGDEPIIDLGTVTSVKGKNGVEISFEFGQKATEYYKDHDQVASVEV